MERAARNMREQLLFRILCSGPRISEVVDFPEAIAFEILAECGARRDDVEAFLKDRGNGDRATSEGRVALARGAARRFVEDEAASVIVRYVAKGSKLVEAAIEAPLAADIVAAVLHRQLPGGLPSEQDAVGRPLFPSQRGGGFLTPDGGRKRWRRLARRAGSSDGPHGGRRHAVRAWIEQNEPTTEGEFMILADSLGWGAGSLRTVARRYTAPRRRAPF